jgi:ribosomal protein L34E
VGRREGEGREKGGRVKGKKGREKVRERGGRLKFHQELGEINVPTCTICDETFPGMAVNKNQMHS